MRLGRAVAALALVGAAGFAGWHGSRTCGWIDRALGRSGCLGTAVFQGVAPSRNSTAQALGDGRVVMAVEMRTADGWRPGLLVFDPETGAEGGRYPLPLRGGVARLFLSPDGTRLLIACGVIRQSCTETGGDAVVTQRDDLRVFADVAVQGRSLTAYPGTPTPPEAYGFEAVFAAQGSRILAGGSTRSLVLLDAGGTRIAELAKRDMSAFPAAVSASGRIARGGSDASDRGGDRLRFWDIRDGAELGRIEGSAGWRLRAAPFWSDDGAMLFVPRVQRGAMLLDRFRAP
ncbi:hypothetical protein SAMN05421641_1368 [Paracoccus thiocyanatus]|uniref:WD40-like Beta Propeller Repeat n=1 Tax=Paracoccus thiocyanatus TaxID=34006 RepID=A0A1N6ZLL6_9RHOB|nr:hypothetical protein [Paracoccus thiocyanatus]SIR27675.1 hypothetical protein SAMN05421641_1368 [Paracoccus thiocyanatus]